MNKRFYLDDGWFRYQFDLIDDKYSVTKDGKFLVLISKQETENNIKSGKWRIIDTPIDKLKKKLMGTKC